MFLNWLNVKIIKNSTKTHTFSFYIFNLKSFLNYHKKDGRTENLEYKQLKFQKNTKN